MSYTADQLQRQLREVEADKADLWRRIDELQKHQGRLENKVAFLARKALEYDDRYKKHLRICPTRKG